MPTGACGINCDVCKLRLMELCSTCGPGKSSEAERKLEAQKRILGQPCPILACARLNQIDFCLRDCSRFPCENFVSGPYPFSDGFLAMQKRRRGETPAAQTHNRTALTVPSEYWEALLAKDPEMVCRSTGAERLGTGGLTLSFLNETLRVDGERRTLESLADGRWVPRSDSMLELVVLLYLTRTEPDVMLEGSRVAPEGLKEAHYFRGPHALDVASLLDRYGNDAKGFGDAVLALGGRLITMASDVAGELRPLPLVPLTYLLWVGDDEFPAKISVLFDRSIEKVFSASAIWTLVKVVSRALLTGATGPAV
ncbi:MAG: DUF3786 domain-containing protein [Syntrophobacteraceae bacterium]